MIGQIFFIQIIFFPEEGWRSRARTVWEKTPEPRDRLTMLFMVGRSAGRQCFRRKVGIGQGSRSQKVFDEWDISLQFSSSVTGLKTGDVKHGGTGGTWPPPQKCEGGGDANGTRPPPQSLNKLMFKFLASSWCVDSSFMGLALVYDLKDPPRWGELGHRRSQWGCGEGGATAPPQPNVVRKNVRKMLVLKCQMCEIILYDMFLICQFLIHVFDLVKQ